MKYYKPEIEEFHPGFEYEYKNGIVWTPMNFSFGLLRLYPESPIKNETRVKCLDEEDFLKLGWIESEEKCPYTGRSYFIIKKEEGFNTGVIHKIVLQNTECINYSWESYSSYSSDKGQINFRVKNKSELKKLMKQLEI